MKAGTQVSWTKPMGDRTLTLRGEVISDAPDAKGRVLVASGATDGQCPVLLCDAKLLTEYVPLDQPAPIPDPRS